MAVLTKANILKGINDPEKITINALNGELYLRPLSSAELDEVDAIETNALGVYETTNNSRLQGRNIQKSESLQRGKMNLSKVNEASNEARYRRIELSLTNPHYEKDPWTEEEIRSLSRRAIEELDEKILELSGVNVEKSDIDKFPEDE